MALRLAIDDRPEVPSGGELWSILLGVLFASALLAAAFLVASSAGTPLADDERAYQRAEPVIRAAEPREGRRAVLVRPEGDTTARAAGTVSTPPSR